MLFFQNCTLISIYLATGLALVGVLPLPVSARQSQFEGNSKSDLCTSGLRGQIFSKTELYFGLSKPDGSNVTEKEFQAFLNNIVTPLFPDGLTIVNVQGQFKDSSGKIKKENSKLLILLYPFSEDKNQKVEKIREEYKYYFKQESVLRTDEQTCTSF